MLRLLPATTVCIAALLAVLPFGADEMARYAVSFLPLMVIQYWSARRPAFVPVPLIFGVGLIVDILTHGPVGYWALLALIAAGFAPFELWAVGRSTAIGRALTYAAAMLVTAGVAWAVASLYTGNTVAGRPFLGAALAAMALYPVMALGLMAIDRLWETPRSQLFVRGS
jgi:rod shape-determining protein MreD